MVPDGIREAVLLRTARLSGQERMLLETAAVAGQEFDIDPVLAVCGLSAWPDGFTGAGLLTEVRDGRAAFRHSLTHEAAYADIGWSRRRDLHRELARTLAAGGAAPALIAMHQLAARDFGAAREALIEAADAHCAVHAYRDAARALRTVLEHWPADTEDDTRLAVVGRLARCAEMCSEYAEAVTLLRELADGHERRGEAAALAVAQRRLALVHELRGQWEAGADRAGGGGRGVLGGGPAGRGGRRPAGRGRPPARRGQLLGRPGHAGHGPGRRRRTPGGPICCCGRRACAATCWPASGSPGRASRRSGRRWTRRWRPR